MSIQPTSKTAMARTAADEGARASPGCATSLPIGSIAGSSSGCALGLGPWTIEIVERSQGAKASSFCRDDGLWNEHSPGSAVRRLAKDFEAAPLLRSHGYSSPISGF